MSEDKSKFEHLSPGQLADKLYRTREERYALNRRAKAKEEDESALKKEIKKKLHALGDRGAIGRKAKIELETKEVVRIESFLDFLRYILRTKSFDMVQKRANDRAVLDRIADKKKVRGVTTERIEVVRCQKR